MSFRLSGTALTSASTLRPRLASAMRAGLRLEGRSRLGERVTEMAKAVPDDYMHIGGDEVITGCWLENPNITSWMMQHGITTGTELAPLTAKM